MSRPQLIVLRAVNVGGNTIKPKALAESLGLWNTGAAGTFVAPTDDAAHIEGIRDALPFETEIMTMPGDALLALLEDAAPAPKGAKSFVTFLGRPSEAPPSLPLDFPEDGPWQLRVVTLTDRYALCHRRPKKPGTFYPNELLEKHLGVPGTTRTLATLEKAAAQVKKMS